MYNTPRRYWIKSLIRFLRIYFNKSERTNEIIDRIRILGNCSNKSAYAYTEADVNKIFSTIERQLKSVKAKFTSKREKFNL